MACLPRRLLLLVWGAWLLLPGCQRASVPAPDHTLSPAFSGGGGLALSTSPSPEVANPTATQTPSAQGELPEATIGLALTPLASPTSIAGGELDNPPLTASAGDGSPDPLSSPSATPCPPDVCRFTGAFPLARPIAPPSRDTVDASYRFGSTQAGARDPHHGVEFLNSLGTPVLAAADGLVVVAGDDRNTLHGPYYNFYGNLVVLGHTLPGITQTVYTLYAHLSAVHVAEGQFVRQGTEIGAVGMSGVATGSHLHFEVRLGENGYPASRNPELWLDPGLDAQGQPQGALAGRILAAPFINLLEIPNVVVERLSSPGGEPLEAHYLDVYQENLLAGQPPWGERFGLGGLPAGWYRVSFVQYGMQSREVQVLPGQLTLVTFDLRDQE